jgi:spore germination protein
VIYVDGLADQQMVEDFALRPLKSGMLQKETYAVLSEPKRRAAFAQMLELADMSWRETMDEAVVEILSGNTILFFDGIGAAMMISSKNFPSRGISEVDSEKTLRGAKDSFNENMRTSTALLRRRIRDGRLKIKQIFVGERSRTNVAICYVDGLVRRAWLSQLEERLNAYDVDAVYDSGMIEQLLEPEWKSVFPQFQHTQRPDKAASALLEGRVVMVVDNSPDVLILPATMNTFFQSADDYYCRHCVAVFARILRYVAAVLAIGLPGLYLSIIGFHTEILPVKLVLTIAAARQSVPFPAVVEILLMELEFELLREAGIRLPGQLDNTIGVVGGLIVGQAAVEAGLVSTIVVIVVAVTAIASFAIPNESFTSAFRLLKFFFIMLCAFWGIYGFFLGMVILLIHLSSLESFGVPYLMPAVSSGANDYDDIKDFILKKSIFSMWKRPIFTRRQEQVRLSKRGAENEI